MSKGYLIFAFDGYFPCDGWNDLIGEYTFIEDFEKTLNNRSDDYIQIVSLDTLSVVKKYERVGNSSSGFSWKADK